jgi:hypothetical protein
MISAAMYLISSRSNLHDDQNNIEITKIPLPGTLLRRPARRRSGTNRDFTNGCSKCPGVNSGGTREISLDKLALEARGRRFFDVTYER